MKTCEECKYYYEEHCCNGASDQCTEYVDDNGHCDKWECNDEKHNAD